MFRCPTFWLGPSSVLLCPSPPVLLAVNAVKRWNTGPLDCPTFLLFVRQGLCSAHTLQSPLSEVTFTLLLGFLALSDLKQTPCPLLNCSAQFCCLPWSRCSVEARGISGLSVFPLAFNLLTGLTLLHHHASGVVNDQRSAMASRERG